MTMPSHKVTASHLGRKAYLYVRQSSMQQVFENTESTERQYALKQRAVALGWRLEDVSRRRLRPGPVGRIGGGPSGIPESGGRGRHGSRRRGVGAGGIEAGPQQQ